MKQIVDTKNHKQILTSLFEKFKKEHCQLAIEIILEIESDLTTMFEEDQVDDSKEGPLQEF